MSGGTSSGKTTLLGVLSAFISRRGADQHDRGRTDLERGHWRAVWEYGIEDYYEPVPDRVRLSPYDPASARHLQCEFASATKRQPHRSSGSSTRPQRRKGKQRAANTYRGRFGEDKTGRNRPGGRCQITLTDHRSLIAAEREHSLSSEVHPGLDKVRVEGRDAGPAPALP